MSRNTLLAYGRLLRPRHWLKNLMLLFPPFFGGLLFSSTTLRQAILPLAAFCLGASAIYVVNDLVDAEQDRRHPGKRRRPVAAGVVSRPGAQTFAVVLAGGALALALLHSTGLALFLLAYQALMLAYSLRLKQMAVVDVFCIAAGFLLRLEAGGLAFDVRVSPWLFLTVLLLALFLALGKRLGEQKSLGEDAGGQRQVLAHYPAGFLEAGMVLTGAAVLVTYAIYVIDRSFLVYTVPLCCFALFKYLHRVWQGGEGNPVDTLLRDPVILLASLAWLVTMVIAIYR